MHNTGDKPAFARHWQVGSDGAASSAQQVNLSRSACQIGLPHASAWINSVPRVIIRLTACPVTLIDPDSTQRRTAKLAVAAMAREDDLPVWGEGGRWIVNNEDISKDVYESIG